MHSIFMEAINKMSSFSFNNMNEDRIIIFFLFQELVLIYRLFNLFCIDVNQFNLIMICSGKRGHMNYIYKSLLQCNNK